MHGHVYWIPSGVRREVVLSSGGVCRWCGKKASKCDVNKRGVVTLYDENGIPFHIDHVIPVAKGGKHTIENLVIACKECNLSKRNKKDANDERIKSFMYSING